MYARGDHPLRSERLRWALLIFGALAFMDAYLVWSGPFDHLPFGEDEHGLSDPAVLTEEFGWSVLLLVNRYLKLARLFRRSRGRLCSGTGAIVNAPDLNNPSRPVGWVRFIEREILVSTAMSLSCSSRTGPRSQSAWCRRNRRYSSFSLHLRLRLPSLRPVALHPRRHRLARCG